METFSALLAICAGNSPVPGEFPAQRPVTRSFGVFFDLHLNKQLSKHSWGWWFETLSCLLWRHCSGNLHVVSVESKLAEITVKLLCLFRTLFSKEFRHKESGRARNIFFAIFQNFNVTDRHVTLKWFSTLCELTLLRNLIHAGATPVYIQGPIRQENENIVRWFDKRSYSK